MINISPGTLVMYKPNQFDMIQRIILFITNDCVLLITNGVLDMVTKWRIDEETWDYLNDLKQIIGHDIRSN
jgi:hypothetical protein